jgi:hypothetical protein
MAAEPLFIDSGGFYALISSGNDSHKLAVAVMEEAAQQRRRAITTDYIIDETATLLRARGLSKLPAEFFRLIEESQALTVEWTTPDRFAAARKFMLQQPRPGVFLHRLREFYCDEGTPSERRFGNRRAFPNRWFQSVACGIVARRCARSRRLSSTRTTFRLLAKC